MIKKTLTTALVASFLLSAALPVFAQTQTTSTQALIESLQKQIVALQAQIESFRKAQSAVISAAGEVATTVKLLRSLREGMSGNDVKALQAILAKYPDIYPEGFITGFFGKATARAVKRFQEREKLPAVGLVGPKTLEKLVKELEKEPLGEEDDDEDKKGKGKRLCAIVPPGHLIAPGWLRKHDGVRPIVPACQKLPEGIIKLLEGRKGTTTPSRPDTSAPVISNLAASGITNTSAHMTWQTNERANGKVWYSATSPVVAASTTASVSSAAFSRGHDITLTGLTPSTMYYYIAESSDEAGNKALSAQQSFTTLATPDTIGPVISGVGSANTTASTTQIVWMTNETATSKVWYSATSPVVATGTTPMVAEGTLVTSHAIILAGLTPNTVYYYIVESADASGNRTQWGQQSFVTSTTLDTAPPALSGISGASIGTTTSHVVWTTNEPADGAVWYSTATPVEIATTTALMSSSALATSHDFTLAGLTASTTYYYLVVSRDASLNTATSSEYAFTTLMQ